jgi:hypothetical protein
MRHRVAFLSSILFLSLAAANTVCHAQNAAPAAAPAAPAVRQIGTVKSINGSQLTLTTDAGKDVTAVIAEKALLRRIAPGETNIKNATPLELADLQAGDRVRVAGFMAPDGKTLQVLSLVAIKNADLAQKHQQELADWQRRGVGGLVKSVDAANGNVVILTSAVGGAMEVTVHAGKATAVSRYAENSVRFEDAKPAPLASIAKDCQLLSRGNKNAGGTQMEAEQIIFGCFRNIAGSIVSVDAEGSTIVVQDLTTKKPITIRITPSTEIKKLPAQMAGFLAMSLKSKDANGPAAPGGSGAAPAGNNSAAAASGSGAAPQAGGWNGQRGNWSGSGSGNATGKNNGSGWNGAGGNGQHAAGGAPNLQQMLARLPQVKLTDFQKGDAVMLVATDGDVKSATAVRLLGGVEAILTASPKSGSILPPWNLSTGSEGGE